MANILTVITGSRLHGLHTEDSDTDYRGVFMNTFDEMVDPFEKPKENRWIEGATEDDTSYELRKFVREATHGNPNFIEMLYSNQVTQVDDIGRYMLDYRDKFITTQRVFDAYSNYAESQLKKMSLFKPDYRTPKFATAYVRSLLNGIELLREGVITNPVPEWFKFESGFFPAKETLTLLKFTPWKEFANVRSVATDAFARLQVELSLAFYEGDTQREADTAWLTRFVQEAYGKAFTDELA